jgi:hypothetical protein
MQCDGWASGRWDGWVDPSGGEISRAIDACLTVGSVEARDQRSDRMQETSISRPRHRVPWIGLDFYIHTMFARCIKHASITNYSCVNVAFAVEDERGEFNFGQIEYLVFIQ